MSAVPPVSKPITAGSSDISIPEFLDLADLVNEDSVKFPGGAFEMPGPEFPLPEGDDSVPIETDETMYNNDETQSLPGIIDSFWEQFLVGSPLSTDNDEVNSGGLDTRGAPQENGWSKAGNIVNLTEQMGLLSSTNHRDSGNGL
jgi:heat shock transcription factor